jgi:cbb3-type cytochrome oxidase subunit 3
MALLTGIYRRCGSTGLIALGLFLIGCVALVHALSNRGELSMDCAKYLAEKPNDKWVKLSGCVVSRILSVPKATAAGSPTEVYVPIHAEGAKGQREIRLLLSSDHPDDLEFVKMANAQASTSSGRSMFRSSFGQQLEESRDIQGRVFRGLDLADRDRAKLTKSFPTLALDFVIIESTPRPGFAFPFTFLLLGAAASGIRFCGVLKQRLRSRFTFLQGEMAPAAE